MSPVRVGGEGGGRWREAGEEGAARTALASGAQLGQACCLWDLPVVPSALPDTKRGTGVPLPGLFAPRHVLPAAEGGWSSHLSRPPAVPRKPRPLLSAQHGIISHSGLFTCMLLWALLSPTVRAKDLDRLFTALWPGPAVWLTVNAQKDLNE